MPSKTTNSKAEFGLPERTLRTMRDIFARRAAVKKVVVYGSRAMGTEWGPSDIDLTMFGEDLTSNDMYRILEDLEESDIPYMVDLSIFDKLDNAELRSHIERVGKTFYAR